MDSLNNGRSLFLFSTDTQGRVVNGEVGIRTAGKSSKSATAFVQAATELLPMPIIWSARCRKPTSHILQPSSGSTPPYRLF